MMKKLLTIIAVLAMANLSFAVTVSSFDELTLAAESHWGGTGSSETAFASGSVYYPHSADSWSWSGFVYSNETDTTTAGYTNQYSAYAGGGAQGSSNYAASYCASDWTTYDIIPNTATLISASVVSGAYFTNITYAALTMRDGDSFTEKFGGSTGDDADWFKLTIWGLDHTGAYTTTSPVEFYLADYRFTDNSLDYIVDDWQWVNLSSLGEVSSLQFSLSSSDVGSWGMNTPAYFAMDSLTMVPEPVTIALLGLGSLFIRRRK